MRRHLVPPSGQAQLSVHVCTRRHPHIPGRSPLITTCLLLCRVLPRPTCLTHMQLAHSDVVRWASLNSLVANTFVGFFFAPLVGDMSDRLGRKPFMLAGILLGLLPIGAVWMHITRATSFLW